MLRLWWCLDHAVLSLLIQNFAMMNGHCEQTNHRYSIFRPVANLHSSIRTIIGSAPSGRCHPVMSREHSIYWSRPTTTFSICIPNPNRSGPLHPEPVRPAAPELVTTYPLRDIAIYKQYVLQMTGSNFLPKLKLTLSFINDSN